MTTRETNNELMRRVAEGDPAAYRELYDQFKGPILSYVTAMVGRKEALALTQEVFLRAYRTRDTFVEGTDFCPWIWTMTRNCCLDYERRKGNLAVSPPVALAPMNEHEDHTLSPETERLAVEGASARAVLEGMAHLD